MTSTIDCQAPEGHVLRDEPSANDCHAVRRIVESTGYFYPAEVDVAVELVSERINKGTASGYFFLLLDQAADTVGYTCFGPIACTRSSYDLFWIAVHKEAQGKGLGRWLLEASERQIAASGGDRVYIETSGRPQYASTREFYLKCGYQQAAVLEDFYGPGDPKVIYLKVLQG